MKIIATPAREQVNATFTYDLVKLIQHSPDAQFAMADGTYLNNLRTELVRKALEVKASHILFIDSDMRFPADTLERLVAHNKDIVGANCRQRTQDAWTAHKGGKFIGSEDKTGLQEVDSLGMGVTLIKTTVFTSDFRKIPEPWFAMPYDVSEAKFVGEDVYFSVMAHEAGFSIFIDHDLSQEVKHTVRSEK